MTMAENTAARNEQYLRNLRALLWGSTVKQDVFDRWAQGFYFSQDEPTALVQAEGGPCAIIAPVQAFIIKKLLNEREISTWRSIERDKCDQLLVNACTEIVTRATSNHSPKFSMVYLQGSDGESGNVDSGGNDGSNSTTELRSRLKTADSELFHSRIRVLVVDTAQQVERFLKDGLNALKGQYGVLILLYSVIFTKGLSEIRSEMSDPTESMIDPTYGYGSQSLINLMLTGRAVSHVWNHDQNVGGLNLRGIDRQNVVGFLALLEHLRYCEVGSFLKSPSQPVWILGSETHLTVLFSDERRLVSRETPAEHAKRVFRKFDPEGNNFIPTNLLQDVLAELGLVAEPEYVQVMAKRLDAENLGIILLASFMDEFFPEERNTCPDTFSLYHYNGLERSNPDNRISYITGQAVMLECSVKCILESNPMLTVLQTKWPRIEIQWEFGRNPSLN